MNSTTLNELELRVSILKMVYCSEYQTSEMLRAYKKMVSVINSLNKGLFCEEKNENKQDKGTDEFKSSCDEHLSAAYSNQGVYPTTLISIFTLHFTSFLATLIVACY